ncbi:unnamed protein product [Closterium sp. Yama58-4]|nr:unnamed protein product [Closterium sp. Yama58-4]
MPSVVVNFSPSLSYASFFCSPPISLPRPHQQHLSCAGCEGKENDVVFMTCAGTRVRCGIVASELVRGVDSGSQAPRPGLVVRSQHVSMTHSRASSQMWAAAAVVAVKSDSCVRVG